MAVKNKEKKTTRKRMKNNGIIKYKIQRLIGKQYKKQKTK